MNPKLKLSKTRRKKLEQFRHLLGAYVKIDMSVCPDYYKRPLAEGKQYFYTTIVGLPAINCDANGMGDNNGELKGYPNAKGNAWATIDLRSIAEIVEPNNQTDEQILLALREILKDTEMNPAHRDGILERFAAWYGIIATGKIVVQPEV